MPSSRQRYSECIDAAIARMRAFFEGLGAPTRQHAYDIVAKDIDAIVQQLEAHGMTDLVGATGCHACAQPLRARSCVVNHGQFSW